jgi:hypothetical protein
MDTPSPTSSPESADGRSPCGWQDGQQMSLFGPGHALASRSVRQAKGKASTTTGTSGPSSCDSSLSASLQQSLESRLRQRLEGNGSPLYVLTWKHWDMQSGPPICALRASGRRTSGKGCSGWLTPKLPSGGPAERTSKGGGDRKLEDQVAGWPSPQARDHKGANEPKKALTHNSRPLNEVAKLSGWATPQANDAEKRGNPKYIPGQQTCLPIQAGPTSTTSPAGTEKLGQLNPEFVCWLMGYPAEWLSCVDWETLSSRKSRRSS